MSEMVERVARAAFLEFSGDDPENDVWREIYDMDDGYNWEKRADGTSIGAKGFRACARAAIAAMRDPTEAMSEVGYSAANSCVRGDDASVPEEISGEIWRAMIDEAIR